MGFVSVSNIMKKVEKKDEFLLNEMRRVQCSKLFDSQKKA